MSTPRPTEADVEALAPVEECIDPADLMEAMVHAGAWAVIEATTDTADREPSRELYEQTVADVRKWLAARDAEHQREVGRLRSWNDAHERRRSEVELILDSVLGPEEDDGAGEGLVGDVRLAVDRLTARAEAAEADRDEARRELADLRGKVAALAADFDTAVGFRGAATSLRALLPTEDDQQ